jgi:DNA-3-methyladenine glycosylase
VGGRSTAVTSLRRSLAGPVEEAAPRLLGCLLTYAGVTVRITEVEAYSGEGLDPASHAHRGPTPRTEVMFGPPGRAYVYFSYGMHWCLNVVCGPPGVAAAVLVRAGEVVAGLGDARERRPAARSDRELARGPARLCAALGVGGGCDGLDLLSAASPLRLLAADPVAPVAVRVGPRVGISRAADIPWRFWIEGDPSVSRYRPGTRGAPE